ncbi:MAG: FG-GAP repeat protein [Verrucomicrobiales bacterium]
MPRRRRALWADFDGDGAPDLLVAAPWGAIEFFRNSAGRLTRRTGYAELAPVTGLWNCPRRAISTAMATSISPPETWGPGLRIPAAKARSP